MTANVTKFSEYVIHELDGTMRRCSSTTPEIIISNLDTGVAHSSQIKEFEKCPSHLYVEPNRAERRRRKRSKRYA